MWTEDTDSCYNRNKSKIGIIQVEYGLIVQEDLDIQNKSLVGDRSAQLDRVGDFRRVQLFGRKVKKRTDKSFQYFVVSL